MTPEQISELFALLMRQEELLKQLVASINKPRLGLHSDAGSCKVYCNRHNKSLWYTLSNDEPVAITQTALTGYLRELKFEKSDRNGEEKCKLLISIQADKLYILESGYDTHFSKSILAAVALLTPQQLYSPVTIQPQAGDKGTVLFCRVWAGSELIIANYNEQTDFKVIARQAIEVVKAANEIVF
ncbi:hypothetical protein WKK05_03815 [Nostoc sp. UHCC 0302]|uniref:hypothetical protein n=1 Tax=Nostoc sp. UHCC 0302 TaxID=3134896 RepID=UPI00311C962D